MKPAYYPKAWSDEGVTMQFDLVCSGEARSMMDQPREQMAASGTKPTSPSPWPMSDAEGKADIELSMLEVSF
jgi:hypothetical protein